MVVSNSSPLTTLARIGQFDLLRQLFARIHIAGEVHEEVVVRGAGRPAAALVQAAQWIEIHLSIPAAEISALRSRYASEGMYVKVESGHEIHLYRPAWVIEAIRQVVSAVQQPTSLAGRQFPERRAQ
jgi:hypothetical protein